MEHSVSQVTGAYPTPEALAALLGLSLIHI